MKRNNDDQLNAITEKLKAAYADGNRTEILKLYEEANELDLDECSNEAFQLYDEMVSVCNDYLYEKALR